mgnify:CR=1 FL=1
MLGCVQYPAGKGEGMSPDKSSKKTTILVVDDEEPIRFLCEDLLASLDYVVLTAPDGEAALAMLKERDDIDIVISDLRMPGIDGLEVTRRVRSEHPTVDVIVLTGFASIESAVESMKLGASDFIRKPFNLNTLISSVTKIVERRNLAPGDEDSQTEDMSMGQLLKSKMAELDELKNEFITITSHELLTPLTPISGYIDTLREGSLGELTNDQREALDTVHKEIEKLRGHIRNLLSIRDLQGAGMKFELAQVDLRELLADAVRQVATLATERKVSFRTEAEGDLEITTDPVKLTAVAVELLSNAIKFNSEGGEIAVSIERRDSNVAIVVQDDGIGIEETDLPQIFEKFYQIHRGDTRNYEGIGIGLTVARGIIEALGGTIDIESAREKGTRVTVTLPVND